VQLADAAAAELPLAGEPFLLLGGLLVFSAALARHLHMLEVDDDRLLVFAPGAGRVAPGAMPSASGFSGLAVCRPGMMPRLRGALRGEKFAAALDALLAAVPTLAIAGHEWARPVSRPGEKQALRLLRRSLGKPSDGFFSRHLNRHLSWPLSRLLIRLQVSPNQVTMANLALGLLSGWLIGRGGYGNTLAAGLLFQFVSVFDGCDGEIARLTFRFSVLGAKLDNLCDFVTLTVFFLNLPIGLYAAGGNISYLVLGAAMVLVVAVFYLLLLARIKLSGHRGNIAELARQVQDKGKGGRPLGWMERIAARLGFIYRKEFISLGIMALCLIDQAAVVLWGVVISASMGLAYEVYHIGQLVRRKRTQ
jgi:phosphatidylglycerophosphate synthase